MYNIQKSISKAYVCHAHTCSNAEIPYLNNYTHYEGAKYICVIDITSRPLKELLRVVLEGRCALDDVLFKNLDFEEEYASSLKEEEVIEVKSDFKHVYLCIEPVLTHLEEIAEMNERLRAKRIFYFCFIGV